MFDLFDAASDRALHCVDEAQNNIEKCLCVHVQMYVKQYPHTNAGKSRTVRVGGGDRRKM